MSLLGRLSGYRPYFKKRAYFTCYVNASQLLAYLQDRNTYYVGRCLDRGGYVVFYD